MIIGSRKVLWCSVKWKWSLSVVSDSSPPHGLQPTRLLHPWGFLGKRTGVGCHRLLRGIVEEVLKFSATIPATVFCYCPLAFLETGPRLSHHSITIDWASTGVVSALWDGPDTLRVRDDHRQHSLLACWHHSSLGQNCVRIRPDIWHADPSSLSSLKTQVILGSGCFSFFKSQSKCADYFFPLQLSYLLTVLRTALSSAAYKIP